MSFGHGGLKLGNAVNFCTEQPEGEPVIYEIRIQHVEPQKRDEYIKVFGDILKNANYAGSHDIKFFTGIEDPSRVILVVEWDSVEAHSRIRGTQTYTTMREATARYQTKQSDGGHFVLHELKS